MQCWQSPDQFSYQGKTPAPTTDAAWICALCSPCVPYLQYFYLPEGLQGC